MPLITIPKKMTKGDELVVIPRSEYEEISRWRKMLKPFKEFVPTSAQKRDVKQARADYRKGRYITLHEAKRRMAA